VDQDGLQSLKQNRIQHLAQFGSRIQIKAELLKAIFFLKINIDRYRYWKFFFISGKTNIFMSFS
jgi:hypothetical protein